MGASSTQPQPMPNLTRRQHLQLWPALAGGAAWPLGAARAAEPRTLRVMAWPGYAEPEVVSAFEAEHGVQVQLTVVDSDQALWRHLAADGGAGVDVFAVNTAELQRAVVQGLVAPVAPGSVPRVRDQLPRFQQVASIQGLVHGGQTMAVPFTYADMGLIYSKTHFSQPPRSLGAMWDPRWRGRVLAYDGGVHNFSLAAQMLGLSSPFQLSGTDWRPAVERLVALRRNVAGFYLHPEQSVQLFQRRQAVLMFANYGSQQLHLLQQAGLDVGYAIPEEGALAWLDCWAITRACRQPVLAAAWINHLLGPAASGWLVSRQGLANTTTHSPYPNERLLWLQPPEDAERRERLWARIVSGDRVAKVLAL